MGKQNNGKIIGLSLAAGLLLGTSAYAGKIITDANLSNVVVEQDTQFGFGGWNLDNVVVTIIDAETGDPVVGKDFFPDGSYLSMDYNDSFKSDVSTGGELRAVLRGKDWPVGEPAGVKIINGDTKVQHGKPVNCIMTSSYLEFQDMDDNTSGTGYLDAFPENMPNPVICSSPFQTHKRFKVNMLPTMVVNDDAFGQPVELIFNLDTEDNSTEITRYQVLQKINNYTDKRLNGYKVEILDGNGDPSPYLTLSLGEGENDGADIWEVSEMANMSHGLWGPVQKDRFDNGFFDYKRAYYPVTLDANKQMISYQGPWAAEGGNYQEIFGDWLPSIWEPTGMFYDDDNDPLTDAVLEAFFGVAPGLAHTTENLKWWKRTVENPYDANPTYIWSEPTVGDIALWSGDPLYSTGPIEDVLNLGLNYIVEIGDNTQIPTGKFMLRITPSAAADQTPPVYVGVTPPTSYTASEGQVAITPIPTFTPGTKVTLSVGDADLNVEDNVSETVDVTVSGFNDIETVTLTETDVNSSVFTAKLDTQLGLSALNDGILDVEEDGIVTLTYIDANYGTAGEKELNATTIAHTYITPTADAGVDISVPVDESVTIVGIGTVDPYYDDYVYYEWKDKDTSKVYSTSATLNIPANTLAIGVYTLTFKVTDQEGKSATDDMVLTVTAPLEAPTADAGPDVTVTEGESVTITGSGTDTDGTIVSYEWKHGTDVVATTASFDTPTDIIAGSYTLTLTVTDNDGLTGTDSMILTVTEAEVPVEPTDPVNPIEPTDPVNPIEPVPSSGGGGCTYNPNSNSFDMSFLFMMALGLLYPVRRRFMK